MTLQEAIEARHSVRAYKELPLADDIVKVLKEQIAVLNHEGNLHIQLILNEPKAFQGTMAKYGKFRNVSNYIVMAGKKAYDLDERVGYYGEHLVLLAQTLGLNTCWVGLSYSKVPGTYVLDEDEKIACYIALGYGETQGVGHKIKTVEQVSNASDVTPLWFRKGVEAALLAPTAVNQQKFSFEYAGMKNSRHLVHAKKGFSIIGYTQMDLGIAKYHLLSCSIKTAENNPTEVFKSNINMKKVVVISTSLRHGSNSDMLADQFAKGAKAAGNEVEIISLVDKSIQFCKGCLACQKLGRCVINDDANEIMAKVLNADVVCWVTPIYYYEMSGQMKTLIDRMNAMYELDYQFRDVYLLTTAADDDENTPKRAETGLTGWIDCYPKSRIAGTLFCGGVNSPREIEGNPKLQEAFELGKSV